MRSPIKRIALSTGGGDAPGLNAVIRAATLAARNRDWDVVGIRDGFNGLLFPERYPEGGLIKLTRDGVRGIVHLGGTIIGTTDIGSPIAYPVQQSDGTWITVDRTEELLARFEEHRIDALITIGGDGTMEIASHLHEAGLRLVGVPKTIDNDLDKTVATFGFDSAVDFACGVHRPVVLHRGITRPNNRGGSDGPLRGMDRLECRHGVRGVRDSLTEIPYTLDPVAALINERVRRGAKFSIVCVAEGARPAGGEVSIVGKTIGQAERFGGVGAKLTAELARMTGREARTVVLGHLLRGGSPTSFDRVLGLRFGGGFLPPGRPGRGLAARPPADA